MPLYAATYETACMTRQSLEELIRRLESHATSCRSRQCFCSLSGGRLIWLFDAPDRSTLEAWLSTLQLGNFQWLVRVDYHGTAGELIET